VVLGRVVAAHGVRGWLKVQSYTDPPTNLLDYPHWQLRGADGGRATYELAEARVADRGLLVRLAGVDDRDAAELLRGHEVEVERAALPPTAEHEYYCEDLLGLAVRTREGVELGRVSHFVEAPAAAVMVVKGAREHWVPAVPRHLLKVDLARGEIEVDWPAEL
jgi:16S rRNA processing protein RimM